MANLSRLKVVVQWNVIDNNVKDGLHKLNLQKVKRMYSPHLLALSW